MRLRTRLLAAQVPFVLALVAFAAFALASTGELGRRADRILRDNYRSVLCAERMKESAERIDSGALFLAAGREAEGAATIDAHVAPLERELRAQEGNVTEPGETEATADLRAAWGEFRANVDAYRALPAGPGRIDAYFGRVAPSFFAFKARADRILELNQDAMTRKSDEAAAASRRILRALAVTAVLACAAGAAVSAWLTVRILRPLGVLRRTARRIGEGDFSVRASVDGGGEIAEFADEINAMAGRLEGYRAVSEGEVAAAHRSLQGALDSVPDPAVLMGLAGDVRSANEAARKLLGPAEPDPSVRAALDAAREHVARTGSVLFPPGLDQVVRAEGPDGPRSYVVRAAPVHGADGTVQAAAILLQDVTRLVRASEMKDDLVATVAHEFRTPLTSLRMAILLCLEDSAGPTTAKQRELLSMSRADCERLQRLVDDMLDLARLRNGASPLHVAAVDASAILDGAAAAAASSAREAGVTLACAVQPGAGAVAADLERARLALGNFVSNAVRHSPRGGSVELGASRVPGGIRFEVRDRGPGVPSDMRDVIFERGSRGAGGGAAGLGLWIAREIVRAHGGSIGVEPREGGGSVFWLTLPASPAA
ncbi:MAG: Alginate biosynthesis sensor protein KinB [Planctomycetes bacterium]|nr:Alginate biosynthesis sensor protein KinB [Planctomycetota bacterium]